MKTLTAHEQPVSKIFSDDYVFHIPGYQRPYAWTTEESRELFEDLIGFMAAEDGPVEKMAPYFLGSVVLIKSEDSPHSDVVDGQQRFNSDSRHSQFCWPQSGHALMRIRLQM